MFYLKTTVDGAPKKIDIYDDEIYTRCFNCGKEFQIDSATLQQVLADGGDFASTSIGHVDCDLVDRPTKSSSVTSK